MKEAIKAIDDQIEEFRAKIETLRQARALLSGVGSSLPRQQPTSTQPANRPSADEVRAATRLWVSRQEGEFLGSDIMGQLIKQNMPRCPGVQSACSQEIGRMVKDGALIVVNAKRGQGGYTYIKAEDMEKQTQPKVSA